MSISFKDWVEGKVFESPQLVDSTDFNLNDVKANKALAADLLKKKKETFEETDDFILFLTGDKINGYIALYNKDGQTIDYIIRYQAENKQLIGKTISQVALWRKRGSPWVQGLTRKVFFDYLLKTWPAIMSDRQQTEDGMLFWDDRMAEALTRKLKVGIADFSKGDIEWFTGKPNDYLKWIRSHEGWGDSVKFQNFRYVISTEPRGTSMARGW